MMEDRDDLPAADITVPAITTICRDCVFATWDGIEQTGCDWDRPDKFEENGAEVIGQDDGKKRYLAIVGRYCNACRNRDWADQLPGQDLKSLVALEFLVRVHFVIYADAHSSLQQIEDSLDSVLDQGKCGAKASGVTLVLNDPPEDDREYLRLIRGRETTIPWTISHAMPDEGVYPEYGKAVDEAITLIKDTTYYAIARAGYVWLSDYLWVIERAINYEMCRVVALLPDDNGDALLMNVGLHNQLLKGNRGQPVIEKVFDVAREEGTGHMIRTWEDLRSCVLPA